MMHVIRQFFWDMKKTIVIFLLAISFTKLVLSQEVITGETCFREKFEAQCNGTDIILMAEASFGRLQAGRCIKGEVGFLGCSEDILPYMDRKCSGRSSCSVTVLDLTSLFNPCSEELLSYLFTSYKCQPVTSGIEEQCRLYNETQVGGSTGIFHSSTPHSEIYGTQNCPWVVSTLPGQRIMFMVYDFTLQDTALNSPGTGRNADKKETCAASLVVDEIPRIGSVPENREGPDPRAGIQLCGGSLRKRHVYTTVSSSARIHITFIPELQTLPYFLISFEAVGCPWFESPDNMWASVNQDIATVICNFTGETWYLICRDTSWVGELGNCTQEMLPPAGSPGNLYEFPWGILIAVVVGVAIGTIVGLSLLGLVFLCRRCFCPDRKKPELPARQVSMTAREVPPMNELIRSATVMAKQGDPHRQPYSTYQRSPHPYTTNKFAHKVEYHPQGSVTSREEHVYESYIYKDGTIRSRKDSASESGGSGYCDMEGSVISDFPVGRPVRISQDHGIVHGIMPATTGAHPLASGDIDKL